MKKLILIVSVLFLITSCAGGSKPTPDQLSNNQFTKCPYDHQQQIRNILGKNLIDPYSAQYEYSTPEKYVYEGNFGYSVYGSVNAKNRLGGYVGKKAHMFMCFPNGTVKEINEISMGIRQGLSQ